MHFWDRGLQLLGWIDGRNVQIDYRLAAGNADNIRNTRRNCGARAAALGSREHRAGKA
jgi:hypothetical protein